MKMKTCPKCKQTKPVSQFRLSKKYKDGLRSWCNKCESDSSMRWKDKHRKQIIEFYRKHVIQTIDKKGKRRQFIKGLLKRPYPDDLICEICKKKVNTLHYHHWNDKNPSKGIWMCYSCHQGCNFIEKKILFNRYIKLKSNIDANYNPNLDNIPNGVSEANAYWDVPKTKKGF